MRKIKSHFFISLDGVVEAPNEWHFPYFNDEMGAEVGGKMAESDTMLLGRQTYEEFAASLNKPRTAIIMVPIVEAWKQSYENDEVSTSRERDLHFGQFDHVRYYGADLRERIKAAGFELEEFTASPSDCVSFGLMRGETVFLASRPA